MANIENLNFQVILQHTDFDKQVDICIKKANELNTSLSNALNFKKHMSGNTLSTYVNELNKVSQATKRAEKSTSDYGKAVQTANVKMGNTSNLLRTISNLTGVAFSVVGIRRFLSTLIDVTGQFEVQKMALRNMLQDIDGANKIFEQLYNFSSQSTYRFSELAKYAKQLAAFNIDQGSLLETTKMLGDVASGVGVSMDRIILAYGHVKSSGFLRGIQLRSFSQNGVPVLEELSKMLTEIEGKAVSLGDVFDKMMKREITFDMVEEAFKRMTSEGGKFYQMQEVLAKTLAGQINILKGKWENLMYAMGESQQGVLKGVVGALTNIVSSTENFGKAIKIAIALIGGWRVAVIAAAVATNTMTLAQTRFIALLQKSVALAFNPTTYAVLGLAAAIGGTVIAINNYTKAQRQINNIHEVGMKEVNRYAEALSEERAELDRLMARLKLAKEGTEDYATARNELSKRFNPYIEQLRSEGKEVSDLSVLYEGLADKIEEANRQRFLESASEKMGEAYGKATSTIADEFDKYIKRVGGLSIAQQEMLRSYYKGALTKEQALAGGVPERAFTYGTPGGYSAFSMGYTPYQMGYKQAGDSIDALKDKYAEAGKVLEDSRKDVANAMDVIFGPGAPGARDENTERYVTVEQAVSSIKKDMADIAALEKKAAAGGLLIDDSKGIDEEKQLQDARNALEEDLKQYKALTGKDYNKTSGGANSSTAQEEKEEIRAIKSQISLLEKYADAREKLEPYFGEGTDSVLAQIFGSDTDYATLDQQIRALCADLTALGAEGAEAAEQIEARLGLDQTSAIIKSQKAIQAWQKELDSWLKDWGGTKTGAAGKLETLIAKYNNEEKDIEKDYQEALKKLFASGGTSSLALDTARGQRRRANRMNLREGLGSIAEAIFKEQTAGLDLTNWGDKSVAQIRKIRNALAQVELPEDVKAMLDPELLKVLEDALNKLVSAEDSKAAGEGVEKLVEDINKAASAVKNMFDAIADYGEASGNTALADLASTLGSISVTAASVAESFVKGNTLDGILSIISFIVSGIAEGAAAAARFEAALRSAREEARRAGFSDMLTAGVDSLFGTNGMAKVNNALAVMKKAREAMADGTQPGTFTSRKKFWDYFVNGGAREQTYTLAEMAASVGRDLYDAYGNLNAETLEVILDTYEDLGQSEREWITKAINDSEAYAEALEQLNDVVQSVFGQMASSAADAIVEGWKERSDAALDYADILDDVATRYAKMMVESAILDRVLTPEKASSIVDMFSRGDTSAAMEQIASDMESVKLMAPVWEQILEAFDPYFNRSGSSSGSSLKEGINKELVEGNSSLIASYMNAMRADLSVLRTLQTSGWADVRTMREFAPTYAEYMAQIAANTFDAAQASQGILLKLQSVITASTTGGNAVRTTR